MDRRTLSNSRYGGASGSRARRSRDLSAVAAVRPLLHGSDLVFDLSPITFDSVGAQWRDRRGAFTATLISGTSYALQDGSAYDLDGVTNNYGFINNDAALFPASMTVEAWVMLRGSGTNNGIICIAQEPTGNTGASWGLIASVASSNRWCFSMHTASTAWADYIGTSQATDRNGLWTHLVGTYTSNDLRLFVNGVQEVFSSAPTGDVFVGTGPLHIGQEDSWEQENFDGLIALLRLWNRALTPGEAMLLYRAMMPDGPR